MSVRFLIGQLYCSTFRFPSNKKVRLTKKSVAQTFRDSNCVRYRLDVRSVWYSNGRPGAAEHRPTKWRWDYSRWNFPNIVKVTDVFSDAWWHIKCTTTRDTSLLSPVTGSGTKTLYRMVWDLDQRWKQALPINALDVPLDRSLRFGWPVWQSNISLSD